MNGSFENLMNQRNNYGSKIWRKKEKHTQNYYLTATFDIHSVPVVARSWVQYDNYIFQVSQTLQILLQAFRLTAKYKKQGSTMTNSEISFMIICRFSKKFNLFLSLAVILIPLSLTLMLLLCKDLYLTSLIYSYVAFIHYV